MFNPYQYQPYQPYQKNVANTPSDDRIFVANIDAANAYLVAPGGFVRLWDSSKPYFYEKGADLSGRQYPMAIYEYHEYKPAEPQAPDYESRFRAIEERLAAFEKGVNNDPHE